MNYCLSSPLDSAADQSNLHPATPCRLPSPTQLVVIDAAVEDAATLVSGVLDGAIAVILDADRDGVEQLSDLLKQYSSIRQLHLVAHGSPGWLQLGNGSLSLETIALYSSCLRRWAIDAPELQLFLYGCHVAAGDAGQELLDRLSELTGAAIAASTQAIGNPTLGGTWELETTVGHIAPCQIFHPYATAAYAGVLNNQYHVLASSAFTQDWSNADLITSNNSWASVPSIEGYRGDNLTTTTGVNPQTVVAAGTSPLNVEANATDPNTLSLGGVAEFQLTNPTIALQGSTSADAPFLLIYLNTAGVTNTQVSFNLRDVDGSSDNVVSPVALQYRVGTTGNFTNLPLGFTADATTGPNQATLVTAVSAILPDATNNQSQVQVRIITTDAAGIDEWIGIDDITITASPTTMNSAPVVTLPSTALAYVENATPLLLDSAATVVDADSPDFNTGVLTVSLSTSGIESDRLTILAQGTGTGQIGLDGKTISYQGAVIGTYRGGIGSEDLIVTLTTNASAEAVQALLRTIAYRNVAENLQSGSRTVEVSLEDGDGSISSVATQLITVTGTNDAPLIGQSVVLYDGSLTTLPTTQGLEYVATGGTETAITGGVELNTTGNALFSAGYFSDPTLTPTLDRTTGYTISFSAQILDEFRTASANKNNDGKDDRAGFSVLAVSSDGVGAIELGFWDDQIWAQEDGTTQVNPAAQPVDGNAADDALTLFTQAESVAFATTTLVNYDLTIYQNTYSLFANDTLVLSGDLRNYTAFSGTPDPYQTPNLIFLGDNTTSAVAAVRLTNVAVTTYTPPATVTLDEDTAATLAFTLTDFDTPAALSLTASSSDQTVIADADLVVTGTGSNQTLNVTPLANQTGTATLTLNVDDGTDTTSQSLAIALQAVNDAPVLDPTASPLLTSLNLGAGNNPGNSVAEIVVTGSIADIDVAGAVPKAIVVTAVDNSNGIWQYSLNNGIDWINFTTLTGSAGDLEAARLLDGGLTGASTHKVRFVPNETFLGNSAFTFRAWDQTTGTAGGTADISVVGGTTAFSAETDIALLSVVDAIAPTVVSLAPNLTTISDVAVGTGTFTLTVVYSEAMNTAIAPSFGFPVENPTATLTLASGTWTTPTTYVASYSVVDANLSLANVDVQVTGAQDTSGNVQTAATFANQFSIDTLAPLAPSIASLTIDSGTAGDRITTDTTPAIAGTAEARSTIQIFRDGVSVGTATTNTSGNWSYTSPPLAAGNYGFTATATDEAGNVSPLSVAFAVAIDSSILPASAPDLTDASDTGAPTDNLTSDTTPSFTGTAEANSTVALLADTTSLGTTTADATGNWTFTPTTALTAGTYAITARATDMAGNLSDASTALEITIDTTAPSLTLTTPATSPLNQSFVVTATFSEAVTGFNTSDITVTNGTVAGFTALDATTYTFTVNPVSTGNVAIAVGVAAEDQAGNANTAAIPLSLTFDNTAAIVQSVAVPANDIYSAGETLTFSVTFDEAVAIVTPSGAPVLPLTLTSGTVNASYGSGSGTNTLVFQYTPTASDEDVDGITLGTALLLNGSTLQDAAGNPANLTLNNVGATSGVLISNPAGLTNITSTTSDGVYDVGGVINVTVTFNRPVTLTGGNLVLTLDSGGSVVVAPFSNATTAIGTYTIAAGEISADLDVTAATLDTVASLLDSLLQPANLTIPAGNSLKDNKDLVIDAVPLTAPSLALAPGSDTGISNADLITRDTTPTLSGTVKVNSTVQVLAGTTALGTTTADSTGNWSFTPTTELTAGTYSITASATDGLGNVSPISSALTLTLDTAFPTADIVDVTPDPRTASVSTIAIQFSEAIGNFTLANFSLVRNNQAVPLTGATLSSSDGITWTLGNLDASTSAAGSYTLLLRGTASTVVTDTAGNLLLSNVTEAWQVVGGTGGTGTATATPAIDFSGGAAGVRRRGTNDGEVLRGTNNRDSLQGLGGSDRLLGLGGVDRLRGGDDNDSLRGGNGNDRVEGENGTDRLEGENGRDLLLGGNGNDVLRGGAGDDILVGGAGQDTLTGGSGVDMITFNSVTEAPDRITDFNPEDLLDLRTIFAQAAFSGTSPIDRFNQFIQIAQVGTNTEVRIDADGTGSGMTFATLAILTSRSASAIGAGNVVIG